MRFIYFLIAYTFSLNLYSHDTIIIQKDLSQDSKFSIVVKKDIIRHKVIIMLISAGIEKDSLEIKNIGPKKDSLVNFENKWWLYFFSSCTDCVPYIIEDSYQIILSVVNEKLHIGYISNFKKIDTKFDFITVLKDTSKLFNQLKDNYNYYNTIFLSKKFFGGEKKAHEILYCTSCDINSADEIKFVKDYDIKYDLSKHVFYTDRKVLNGSYKFETDFEKKIVTKKIKKDEALILNFQRNCYAFYKGEWYYFYDNIFRSIDVLTSRCKNGCY